MKGSSDILINLVLHHNSHFRCGQPKSNILSCHVGRENKTTTKIIFQPCSNEVLCSYYTSTDLLILRLT